MAPPFPLDGSGEPRDLHARLTEALETIDAIRNGDVDAVVVGGPDGQRVFTLDNVDRPYRVIIEQMQEGAVTLGADGLILYCNQRFANLVGASGQGLVGRNFAEFVDQEDSWSKMLQHGGAGEYSLRHANASGVPVNISVIALEGAADEVLRCAIVTDLTQVKARQAAILHAQDRLRSEISQRKEIEDGFSFALDAADMGSWDLNLLDGAANRSRRHDEIFGYPNGAESWTLESALHHFVEEDRQAVIRAFAGARTSGDLDFEHRIRRVSDGQIRWIHVKGQTFMKDNEPVRIAGVVTDVTDRRLLDEQIRQVQKMDAVGQLTGGIAHDFNNLLTIITGNMDMAGRSLDNGDAPRARRSVTNALKGAERATLLTNRLLAFSRRTPLDPKILDVSRIVSGMAELLGRSLGETVKLETVNGAGLWAVEADPNQLENALLNLAVNARDAMPEGGKLTIETQNIRIDETYAELNREIAPGEYVSIAVTDTGLGMPAEVIAKAFDPFFTTKEVGKGTGLGLSQVYGYVKQTGGHVKIYSERGHGTTIRIYLPRSMADQSEADRPPSHDVERGAAAETVLVVEDDDEVRTYTVESLRELGYRVLEAHDGPSALRLLDRQDLPIRLLFTDVVMPGMSGRELEQAARSRQPDLKVLFTTGYARSAIVHGGRLDAGVELLPKPFTFVELAAKIRDVLDKGSRERILVVDSEEDARLITSGIAEKLGMKADHASSVREGITALRVAGGHFDAIIVDSELPEGRLEMLIAEFRAIRRDVPILITARSGAEDFRKKFVNDSCVAVLTKPFDAAGLRECFEQLKVHCAREESAE